MNRIKFCLAGVLCVMLCATARAGVTLTTFNLENERVRGYMQNVTYKSDDPTKIKSYNQSPPKRRDQPSPVTLSWTPAANVLDQLIVLSRSSDFANADTISVGASVGTYDVYNLVPGYTYSYRVLAKQKDGSLTVVSSGQFKTSGQVRMIGANTIWNVRDLGGWRTRSGFPIRYELIYRGAELNGDYNINASDREMLYKLGIRADLDLRNDEEIKGITASPLGHDVDFGHLNLVHYYYDGIKNYPTNYKEKLQYVFDNVKQGKPVFFHCHIGADRTGNIAFLLEGLLGVSESDIYKDYELTTFSALNTPRYKDQLEDMMAYIKTMGGETLEENFYIYATKKIGLLPEDVMEFKSIMLGHKFATSLSLDVNRLDMKAGDTYSIKAEALPADAFDVNPVYTSSDTLVARVDKNGVVTAVRGGTAVITASTYQVRQQVEVNVEFVESEMSQAFIYNGETYCPVADNMILNGSFEYAHPFAGWFNGENAEPTEEHFSIVEGAPAGGRYISSKTDDDEDGPGTLRALWPIQEGKTYVFAYKVKNTSGKQIVENKNLEFKLTNNKLGFLNGSGDDFVWDETGTKSKAFGVVGDELNELALAYPSYNGEWTDVQYIFTNDQGFKYCQAFFTHLSADGDNTCLDNFYLAEIAPGRVADVNMDGDINASDVVSVYNFILNGEMSHIWRFKADVNADGVVNASDVVSIYNAVINGN